MNRLRLHIDDFIETLPEAHRDAFKKMYERYQEHYAALVEHYDNFQHEDRVKARFNLLNSVQLFFETFVGVEEE